MSPTPEQTKPIEVFFAYAHEDELLRDELAKQLAILERHGLINSWYNRDISAGAEWEQEIDIHLNTAQIILLLVSPDFMASEYCYSIEVEQAMKRHKAGDAIVIPVILRSVDWREALFGKLQALPKNAKPVTLWHDRDVAFQDIARGIRKEIEKLTKSSSGKKTQPLESEQLSWFDSHHAQKGFGSGSLAPVAFPTSTPPSATPRIKLPPGGPPPRPSPSPTVSPPPHPFWQKLAHRRRITPVLLAFLIIVPVLSCVIINMVSLPTPWCNFTIRTCPPVATVTPSVVSISDGRFPFDTHRPDGPFKLQAAERLKAGDISGAESTWQLGLQQKDKNGTPETNDAEALIYLEDQQVLRAHTNSGTPYITFVVATFLTGENVKIGRDNLQGAYVAQKEFNSNPKFALPNGVQVRLLIANSSSDSEANATRVAQQIVQTARQDPTIVGVMGWPYSQSSIAAIKVLAAAFIPMVSQSASSNLLTGISRYFFRVNPTDKQQGTIGAQYAKQCSTKLDLCARRVALFVDQDNSYSRSLAQSFCQTFTGHSIRDTEKKPYDFCQGSTANGNAIVAVANYSVNKPETVGEHLQDALNTFPDLIYLAGYAPEAGILLNLLAKQAPRLKLMGGDAFYDLKAYPSDGYPLSARDRLYFTEFAYPDEWRDLPGQKPPFFEDYSHAFDPSKHYPANRVYAYNRADDGVMLSYDALLALLNGSKLALASGKTIFRPGDLQHALTEITGKQAIQGISGQISFGPDGNPIDKTVLVLRIEMHGYTIPILKRWRFLLTDSSQCAPPSS